ncbi:MAG: hypothetical protein ABJH07_01605 [Sedimentitalea sp.]|uniref:hypothetical protein n=1 Tax=Sedimentitalea sp. TaxID=2048915 RepID=UPI00326773CE
MDLRTDPLRLNFLARVTLDAAQDTFLNFEKSRIRSSDDVVLVRKSVEAVCAPHLNNVDVVMNFDDLRRNDEVAAA